MSARDLEAELWNCAQILRGSAVTRTGWKTHILPLLFFKRISNVWDEETAGAMDTYGEADKDGGLDLQEVKEIVVRRADLDRYILRRGDVLMTEGGDLDKLGRGTVWQDELVGCLHQNHLFAVRILEKAMETTKRAAAGPSIFDVKVEVTREKS